MIEKEIIEVIKDKNKLKELNINERDILVLELKMNLIDGKKRTNEQIGTMVWSTHACFKYTVKWTNDANKISAERVRQIIAKSIKKIRKSLDKEDRK